MEGIFPDINIPVAQFVVEALVLASVTASVTAGVTLVVDQIDKAFQKKIKKYTATYGCGKEFSHYNDRRDNDKHQLLHRLLHMTWYDDLYRVDRIPLFDLLVQIVVDSEVLRIRPLRLLFVKAPAAKCKDKVGIAVSLQADAVYNGTYLKNALAF
jgi:hypothetical protein